MSNQVRGIIFTNLGELYRTVHDYRNAESAYKNAIAIWDSMGPAAEFRKAIALSGLVAVLDPTGRSQEAAPITDMVTKITERALAPTSDQESAATQRKLDRLREEVGGGLDPAKAVASKLPGLLKDLDHDLGQAIQTIAASEQRQSESVTINANRGMGGIRYLDPPPTNNISIIMFSRRALDRSYDQIYNLYDRASIAIEDGSGPTDIKLAGIYSDMGLIRDLKLDPVGANRLYLRARSVAQSNVNAEPQALASIEGRLGDLYWRLSRNATDRAKLSQELTEGKAENEALAHYRTEVGVLSNGHLSQNLISEKQIEIAYRYSYRDDGLRDAIAWAVKSRDNHDASDATGLAGILFPLGEWQAKSGALSDAIDTYVKYISLAGSLNNQWNDSVFDAMGKLGEWYLQDNNVSGAEKILKERLRRGEGDNIEYERESKVRFARGDLAELYERLGDRTQAIKYRELIVSGLGDDGIAILPEEGDKLAILYVAAGQMDDAEKIYQRLADSGGAG
jgi:tetratricopeptide (TPR) repeat protein